MPVKLTKTLIDDVRPQNKEQLIFDSQISGFGLRISPGGRKSFILQYRFRRRSRRLRRETLRGHVYLPERPRSDGRIHAGRRNALLPGRPRRTSAAPRPGTAEPL